MGSCLLCRPCEESQVTPACPLGCPGGSSWPSNAGHLVPLIAPEAGPRDPISAQTLGPRNQAAMTQRHQGRQGQRPGQESRRHLLRAQVERVPWAVPSSPPLSVHHFRGSAGGGTCDIQREQMSVFSKQQSQMPGARGVVG